MNPPTNNSISINFCGGCNPMIERRQISEAVRDILSASGLEIGYNDCNARITVYMSGCAASCIWHYSNNENPCVVVAGQTVDAIAVDSNEIAQLIAAKIREFLQKPECNSIS